MTENTRTERGRNRTDGYMLRDMVAAATRALEANQWSINALNVFPVPDGDTGTNMVLTLRAVVADLETKVDPNPSITSSLMARSALLGARGNSGLIVAQFFKGLAEALRDGYEVSGEGLALGLRIATENAYKAVPVPREGTMLTVFRECADAAEMAVAEGGGVEKVLAAAVEQALDTVRRTPEMLDVLRDAGVVDSGGFGFAVMLSGALQFVRDEGDGSIVIDPPTPSGAVPGYVPIVREEFVGTVEEEAWGYCTVFAITGEALDIEALRKEMGALGRSAVVAGDDSIARVHVHMEDPGRALSVGVAYGELSNVDIKNMDAQAAEWAAARRAERAAAGPLVKLDVAVVAVVAGEGMRDVFVNTGLGAVTVVRGGDSMNPSTAEIADAVLAAPSENVIILPNNKNVVGTARLVPDLTDKRVRIVATESMQQGIAALLAFSQDADADANVEAMSEAAAELSFGAVCAATRNANLNGVSIKRGQYMAIVGDSVVATAGDAVSALEKAVESAADSGQLVTIYKGEGVDGPTAKEAVGRLNSALPGHEIELIDGGQPHYDFLFSVE